MVEVRAIEIKKRRLNAELSKPKQHQNINLIRDLKKSIKRHKNIGIKKRNKRWKQRRRNR